MDIISLILERPLVWGLFLAYMVVTFVLAWIGHKKTNGLASFAIGNGDMHPVVVGITLAASIASTATFVINPGFVYVHGISALMHLGVAAGLGVILGLVVLSPGFRRVGAQTSALTLPQWVGSRFGSPAMSLYFSAITLLSFTFVVLIVGGLALVMQATLGMSTTAAAALVIAFVFSYIFVGGAYAHAYTNTLQGGLMVIVAFLLIYSGLPLLADGGMARLAAEDPNLATAINPSSTLFGSTFSVWVAGFVIGFGLVCQPHILTKALYVKTDRDVRRYLAVTIAVSLAFTGLLLVGLYVRLAGLEPTRQDLTMAVWITHAFGPGTTAAVTVAILAAGMSTLDGLLVALSSTVANDLFLPLAPRRITEGRSPEQLSALGVRVSQGVLVLMGIAAFVVVLDPPKLLGIFGQIGAYGIVAAAAMPTTVGVLLRNIPTGPVFAGAVLGPALHLILWFAGASANPAVTATWGIFASIAVAAIGTLMMRRSPGATESDQDSAARLAA
jgi:sodium/pantothenate symporter